MKKLIPLLLSFLALTITGCNNSTSINNNNGSNQSNSFSGHTHTYIRLMVAEDALKRTYLVGEDFDDEGLFVRAICDSCKSVDLVQYSLENDTNLQLDQTSVTIKYNDLSLEYPIKVVEKYHIACVGDSLTAGHYWANESYPTKLSAIVDDEYQVENCGVNGISITGYGGSWDDPEMRYIKQDVYTKSVNFNPDIFAIMLGTNDATGWAKAEATFDEYYHILLDSYIKQFPFAKFIMMVSPPTKDGNQFGIPNQTIKDEINPRQRDLAEEYGLELLDLREEFEAVSDYESRYLRPNNDGVHFTAEAAEYVATRVWDIAKDLTF